MMWGFTALDVPLGGARGVLTDLQCAEIRDVAKTNGLTLLDTAEGYGDGTSEERLGRLKVSKDFIVMSKFLPTLWRWTEKDFDKALKNTTERLGGKVDVYFIHTPVHPRPLEFWVRCLAKAKQDGRVTAIGLSNFNASQIKRAVIAAHPIKIDCVQVHFSLLVYGSAQLQEMIRVCRENNIAIVGFSPIGQGLLADGLSESQFKSSKIARVTSLALDDLSPLRRKIREISEGHGVTMTQVAVNWSLCKGVIPLIGVRTTQQAKDAIGALSWRLSDEEIKALDTLALDKGTFEKGRIRRAIAVTVITILVMAYRFERVLWRIGLIRRPQLL